jgi:hypothetical protein
MTELSFSRGRNAAGADRLGVIVLVAGLFWPWVSRLPLGRLPGDIAIHRDSFHLYIPLATSILVSVVLTLLFWLFRK